MLAFELFAAPLVVYAALQIIRIIRNKENKSIRREFVLQAIALAAGIGILWFPYSKTLEA